MRASSKASKKNLSAAVRVSRSPLELARARSRRATMSRKSLTTFEKTRGKIPALVIRRCASSREPAPTDAAPRKQSRKLDSCHLWTGCD